MTVMSYRQALHDTLRAEMSRDESVILLGEEIGLFEGSYKITAGLLPEFGPTRVRDTPIAEEGFVGAGIGAVSNSTSGRNLNLVVILIGAVRLMLGGGIL